MYLVYSILLIPECRQCPNPICYIHSILVHRYFKSCQCQLLGISGILRIMFWNFHNRPCPSWRLALNIIHNMPAVVYICNEICTWECREILLLICKSCMIGFRNGKLFKLCGCTFSPRVCCWTWSLHTPFTLWLPLSVYFIHVLSKQSKHCLCEC